MQKLSVPNEDFFSCLIEVMNEGQDVTFIVKGHSMFPFLRNEKDRVVMTECDPKTLHRGDVILFSYQGRYILHRIVRRLSGTSDSSPRFLMRGDGNVKGCEIAESGLIYGVMTKRITPSGKEWRCSSFSWRFFSEVWAILSPFRRLILGVLRRVYK